jgi:hypothetical protein
MRFVFYGFFIVANEYFGGELHPNKPVKSEGHIIKQNEGTSEEHEVLERK